MVQREGGELDAGFTMKGNDHLIHLKHWKLQGENRRLPHPEASLSAIEIGGCEENNHGDRA